MHARTGRHFQSSAAPQLKVTDQLPITRNALLHENVLHKMTAMNNGKVIYETNQTSVGFV